MTFLGEPDGGGQAVRAGADDDGIIVSGFVQVGFSI